MKMKMKMRSIEMRPKHYAAKHKRVCKYCGDEFMSKRINGDVCYSSPCQRMKAQEDVRKRYLRLKQREAVS